jgi:hypothetical protein
MVRWDLTQSQLLAGFNLNNSFVEKEILNTMADINELKGNVDGFARHNSLDLDGRQLTTILNMIVDKISYLEKELNKTKEK